MTNDRAAFERLDVVRDRINAYNEGHAAGYRTGYMDAVWQSYADNITAAHKPADHLPPVNRWHE